MKIRTVSVLIELETDMPLKKLKRAVETNLQVGSYYIGQVKQVACMVADATKKKASKKR